MITNKTIIVPVGKKILLKQQAADNYYHGTTIIIPDSAKKKDYKGYVIAIGKEVQEITVGDLVQYADYAVPTPMMHNGEEHLLVNVGDIFAVIVNQ